ncbi:hypothetical protein [uncultured Corynebacterium sp.]|jgi:hypothetical protein|uniref:hypothetical protein n=1 Tax=uncultured Corynebacterium sp. TaxID=159447 RepID=UPI00206A14C8|nr:hypothetical protein [uncultured Corynebacterium sp.]DAL16616.1 MAG TPA_asm: tail fiber protein [Caudoviricetes sp.]
MPVVSGSLVFVTSRPSAVSEVWVRARDVRTSVQGVVVESNDRIPVANGAVSFEVLPGPAVLTLVEAGRPVDTIPIVVGDASEQSLMDVVDAALIVDESQASVIESLAAQVVADAHAAAAAAAEAKESQVASSSASAAEGSASAADVSAKAAKASQDAAAGSASSAKQSESNAAAFKNAADSSASDAATSAGSAKKSEDAAKAAQARSEEIASSTSWDGDKLTVNGKTSPSLRGPKGDKGETGSVENVSWDDISGKPDLASTWEQVKGKPAAFPPTTHTHTTGQVEGLDDALAGKADKGHTHKVEDVDGLKERLDQQDGAANEIYTSILDIGRKLRAKADESYVKSQIASTRSYVDRAVANGSKIKVVSSLPSYPDSSTVYIVV